MSSGVSDPTYQMRTMSELVDINEMTLSAFTTWLPIRTKNLVPHVGFYLRL